MGTSFDFVGRFSITPPLSAEHLSYLSQFAETRRMRRNPDIAATFSDPIRVAVGLPIGDDAAYFVGGQGNFGQDKDESVLEVNKPPQGQPGLWCQWIPTKDGRWLVWDEGEKFYFFADWLRYLIHHFFEPWGYTIAGRVTWTDETEEENGLLRIEANKFVKVVNGPDWLLNK